MHRNEQTVSLIHVGCVFALMPFFAARANVAYTFAEDGKAYVATVPQGETAYLSDEAAGILNANSVTNFYKRGDGRLVITNNTSSFTGHFWIEDGILTSKPIAGISESDGNNLTMGKVPSSDIEDVAGCGAIHVRDGASFTLDCRGVSSSVAENLKLQNKTTYFEGSGHDSLGALTILSGENNSAGPLGNNFGGRLHMTGDATIRNNINNWMGFNNGRYLDMGGRVLTIASAGSWTLEKLWSASNLGDVVVDQPGLRFDRFMWFGTAVSDSNHTMRVKSGAGLRLQGDSVDATYKGCIKAAYGTLRLEDGAYIELRNSDRRVPMGGDGLTDPNFPDASQYVHDNSKNIWMGPVVLDTPGKIKVKASQISAQEWADGNGRYLQIGGKISGGGLELDENVRLVLRAHSDVVSNQGDAMLNDFTNGIFAAAGCDVTLQWGNLLPTNGVNSALVLSNASLTVKSGRTFNLPHVKCYGDCYFLGTMDNAWSPGSQWYRDPETGNEGDATRETRQYYPSLEFIRDDITDSCSGSFSTNVIVSALTGLPTIEAYPADTSANPVRPCIATSTGPALFQIIDSWNINASDAVKSGRLSFPDGELRFGHKDDGVVAININCDVNTLRESQSYKIAEAASIVFKGARTVTFSGTDSDRWRFRVANDGIYLAYRHPKGAVFSFR